MGCWSAFRKICMGYNETHSNPKGTEMNTVIPGTIIASTYEGEIVEEPKKKSHTGRFTKALYVTTAVLVVGAAVEYYVSKKN